MLDPAVEPRRDRRSFIIALGISLVVALGLLISVELTLEDQPKLPPSPPVTVPFDTRLRTGSDDLPLEQLARQGGLWDPEQIHLALAGWLYIPCLAGMLRVGNLEHISTPSLLGKYAGSFNLDPQLLARSLHIQCWLCEAENTRACKPAMSAGEKAVFVSWATHNATIVKTMDEVKRPDLDSIASQVSICPNSPQKAILNPLRLSGTCGHTQHSACC